MAYKKVDTLNIENATIIFRNFKGEESKFNRAGDRNFSVIIEDPELADKLASDGWNVKTLAPKDEDGTPTQIIPVAVSYKNIPPKVYLIAGGVKTLLDEETVGLIDDADLKTADIIIAPYHWEVNGKSGIKAYLKTAYFVIEEDEFAAKYAEEENPTECPF